MAGDLAFSSVPSTLSTPSCLPFPFILVSSSSFFQESKLILKGRPEQVVQLRHHNRGGLFQWGAGGGMDGDVTEKHPNSLGRKETRSSDSREGAAWARDAEHELRLGVTGAGGGGKGVAGGRVAPGKSGGRTNTDGQQVA